MTGQTTGEIIEFLECLYPPQTAQSWDRVGLVVGNRDRHVTRVLLAVDAVEEVADEALDLGCDLIITHHPLFLRGTSSVSEDTSKGRMVAKLIRADCGLYCAHTNADVAVGGVAEALAQLLGVTELVPMVDEGNAETGLGRVGFVKPQRLIDFAQVVAKRLPAGPTGIFVGGDPDRIIERVAVSGGSGDSLFADACASAADVFVTADLRHHPAQDHLRDDGPALICGSHWATEWPWLPVLRERLIDVAGERRGTLTVDISTLVTEPWIMHLPTKGLSQ